MRSIKSQTYKNIITIVHTDDPRDEYVTGDIIIKGAAFGKEHGNGAYNLYNNRLLNSIPDIPGWFHFIDDDDIYFDDNVIENLVKSSLKDHINVGRVERWDGKIFPTQWKKQKTFQTECFFIHTDHRHKSKWWANLGGDHYYSEQLTKILPINWIDNFLICKAQEGKGRGKRLDKGLKETQYKLSGKYPVLGLQTIRTGKESERIRQGEFKYMDYEIAEKLEKENKIKFSYTDDYKKPIRKIFKI
jgi:hypothetical protein